MKKYLIYTLALMIFVIQSLKAQTIPSTSSQQCLSCVPPGWTGFSTPAGYLPAVSGQIEYGVGGKYITNLPNNFVVSYKWVAPFQTPPSGNLTFLSINNTELVKTSASTTITGLIPGVSYKINAHVSTSKIEYDHILVNGDILYKVSYRGKTAKLTLSNGASGSAEVNFDYSNLNKWIPLTLQFTASANQATLTFSGTGEYPQEYEEHKNSPQIVNLDLAAVPIERICNATNKPIKLTSDTWNPCFGTTENLIDPIHYYEVPVGTPGNIPANFEVRVFDNPNHTGNPITTTTKNGTFYYFFYDKANLCYNTNNSTAKLTVTFQGEQQVFINTPQIFNTCAGTSADLNSTVTPTQSNNTIVWFKSPQHLGSQISNPESVGAGTYYAFYKNPGGCFLTHNSIAKVVVNIPEPTQVSLTKDIIQKLCPSETANLNEAVTNPTPAGVQVHWFTNADHQGAPLADPAAVDKSGIYYAFYYDILNQCYQAAHSTANVNVAIMPEIQVSINAPTIKTTCSTKTIDLASLLSSSLPTGYKVIWYTNDIHSGVPIATSSKATTGTYYAYYFNEATNCFLTKKSTSKVQVEEGCIVVSTIKVFLQGAMNTGQANMRNNLQTYFGNSTGLLPTIDPYIGKAVYNNINNPQGIAGSIVDWVRVEIRSSLDPSILLEAKSLLLRTDGKIVDVTGKEPIFTIQPFPVHVVVKHRNHLPVMSNVLNFTNVNVICDFTTSLLQASRLEADHQQMVQVNGTWCMIAGDVQQDFSIDNTDLSLFYSSFNKGEFDVYSNQDLNLDGAIDNQDIFYFDNGFNAGYFSTIINY